MTPVCLSVSQYWSRSLPDTSALLPTLMKVENPNWRSAASARTARPSAPLCEDIARLPEAGKTGEKDAFRRTSGSAFSNPMQLGPIIRMP